MAAVIISGSSRQDGNTKKVVEYLASITSWDVIDLTDYKYSYYDYNHKNKEDDFLPLMRTVISTYDTIILATPVYWYAMSGIMKVFIDRWTDLITIEKDLGRQLRGKSLGVITSSNGSNLGDNFFIPFKESAAYLGMQYLGGLHTISMEMNTAKIEEYVSPIIENNG